MAVALLRPFGDHPQANHMSATLRREHDQIARGEVQSSRKALKHQSSRTVSVIPHPGICKGAGQIRVRVNMFDQCNPHSPFPSESLDRVRRMDHLRQRSKPGVSSKYEV